MTRFGLIRHGRTRFNAEARFQGGGSDIPLDEVGRTQAHDAVAGLAAVPWRVVVSSTLQRSTETARIVADGLDIPYTGTDPRLNEIDWGAAEGVPEDEADARWPGRTFPDREDDRSVADRAYAALLELAAEHGDTDVLVVAHGTLIRYVVSGVYGAGVPGMENGKVSIVAVEEEHWSVEMVNNTVIEPPRSVPRTGEGLRIHVEKRPLEHPETAAPGSVPVPGPGPVPRPGPGAGPGPGVHSRPGPDLDPAVNPDQESR